MRENSERVKVRFTRGGTHCAAWLYPGTNGACLVMAAGGAVCDQDQAASPVLAARAATRAPRGEAAHLPGGHYAPFLLAHERAVEVELGFLRRYLMVVPARHDGELV